MRIVLRVVAMLVALGAPVTVPAAGEHPFAQRFAQSCAGCHGANGRAAVEGVPHLAGQHSFYSITQLFLFRAGRRTDPGMTAVAQALSDDDLRGYADYIGTLPWVPADATTPPLASDPERFAQARALAREHRCSICHGDDLSGGQQVPRIAGQDEDYLRRVLHEFAEGKRTGYTRAMAEALHGIELSVLDTLAWYAARVESPPSGAAPSR